VFSVFNPPVTSSAAPAAAATAKAGKAATKTVTHTGGKLAYWASPNMGSLELNFASDEVPNRVVG